MVLVRESPKAKISPDKSNANWPPKSPFDALLSSPSGRRKWQERQDRGADRSPSPSPMRKPLLSSSQKLQALAMSEDEDEEDEDEETLQLKLQAIEAKLKLKKLQAKAKKTPRPEKEEQVSRVAERESAEMGSPRKRVKTSASLEPSIQIPVSPVKDRNAPPPQDKSPARVLLGIDKGLRAQDVSLKRPRTGAPIQRSKTQSSSAHKADEAAANRPMSFSERIAASRSTDQDRQAKEERIEKARSRGFGLNKPEDASSFETFSSTHLSRRQIPHTDLVRTLTDKELYTLPRLLKEIKAPHYDPPDCESDFVVFGILASKTSPYDTKPKHKSSGNANADEDDDAGKSKFMVLKLTDLQWEIDLFLFDTAFSTFWKLVPGTLLAILNPSVMPPKTNQHSGRFSLKLASSEDSVLEIGAARDLGFCKSVKKDGKQCDAWVNKRKTEFCDFHVNLALEKTRAGRMEVNGMHRYSARPSSPDKRFGVKSRYLRAGEFANKGTGSQRDIETGERYFMGPKLSAAALLDREDRGSAEAMQKRLREKERERELARKLGRLGNGMGAEYLKRKDERPVEQGEGERADDEKYEKPDAEALGLLGKKASDVRLEPVRGRKRAFQSSTGSSSATGGEAMGWGGAFKRGLLEPKKGVYPERGQTKLNARAESPKKRARFALEKGIREPGRESLGDAKALIDDDDDDLDII
ncbi:hypothetical protein M8818_007655 [Zalaria obscura]|uniref:Uncharacterized protein n=1 Tax=Zalaria obscura TaxID=2024903 RepID=A0ACC3S3R5_9PEZI